MRNVKSAIGESRTPWMSGWNTATFVLYHRLMYGTSRAIAVCACAVQRPPLLVVGRRRRLLDQAIDVGVADSARGSSPLGGTCAE